LNEHELIFFIRTG